MLSSKLYEFNAKNAKHISSSNSYASITSPVYPLFVCFLLFYCLATQFHLPEESLLGKHLSSPFCHLRLCCKKTGGIGLSQKNTHTCYIICLDATVFTSPPLSKVTEVHTIDVIPLSWLHPNQTRAWYSWSYCRILSSYTNISVSVCFGIHLCVAASNIHSAQQTTEQAEDLIFMSSV